jgi:Ca-activated chloride channel family protein
MTQPRVELFPLRPAVRTDLPTTLDVLVRITPPPAPPSSTRPPLNLALVIDRSGSMAEAKKIAYARESAAFAVMELTPTDRVSLTVFDDRIETLAPNAPVTDRDRLLRLIAGVQPRGSTALHGGWAEGAKQVGDNIVAGGLNRVLLLSDGLANVGESRPDAIATDVHTRRTTGVGTSTLGLGNDYNEDLLEAMARSGDGNYYYVESPRQLATIFQTELSGLTATVGTAVLLAVEPAPDVTLVDVLNDFDRAPDGRLQLPNLVSGFPVQVVLRLTVPPTAGERPICAVRLDWAAPGGGSGTGAGGLILPAVAAAAWDSLAPDLEVQERAVLLLVARLKKAATEALARYDAAAARAKLAEAQALLRSVPSTPEIGLEIQSVAEIDAQIERGDHIGSAKKAHYDAYNMRHSKPRSSPRPDDTA